MNKQKLLIVILSFISVSNVFARDNDFGIWTSIEGEKKIIKGLSFALEGEFRSRDNSRKTDRWSGSADLSYRIWPFLKAGASYTYIYTGNEKKKGIVWEHRHRYNIYLLGSYKWNRFNISLRERFQHTYRSGVKKTAKRANPKQVLRSRLQIAYDIKKSKFTPYASCELYHTLNDPIDNGYEKTRWTAGTKYKLNKKNSFDIYYRYQTKSDDDEPNGHILGLGFSHKF